MFVVADREHVAIRLQDSTQRGAGNFIGEVSYLYVTKAAIRTLDDAGNILDLEDTALQKFVLMANSGKGHCKISVRFCLHTKNIVIMVNLQ
jgi:hypothetical protein